MELTFLYKADIEVFIIKLENIREQLSVFT